VKKFDFSNLTEADQSLIRGFLLKLELLTLDNEDQEFFGMLCKSLLKRAFNRQSDFSFLAACKFFERFQKPDSLYRKLRKQNISVVYNETNYIGNYLTDVGRSRMMRNLTGRVIDYKKVREELDRVYHETNQTESLLRRGFETLIMTPYLQLFGVSREEYNSHFTFLKAIPGLIQKSKPGALQYAFDHAWNNVTLYASLKTSATQTYITNVAYVYSRIKYKLHKITFEDRKGGFDRFKLALGQIGGTVSNKINETYQRATVVDPYGSYQILNDTDIDTSDDEVSCTTIYWWWLLDYYDPKMSPFTGFIKGSRIDLVLYFLVIPFPPPRTIITIVDWYISWIRRSYTVNKVAPKLALTADAPNCLPGFPYVVDTDRTYVVEAAGYDKNATIVENQCYYPTFVRLNFTFCAGERAVVESNDMTYCREWLWLDEVFLGWVQFLSTTFLTQFICRVRVLQVLFGWMVYKKDGIIVCSENNYTGHLPPMMGKCLFFKFVSTFCNIIIFFLILIFLAMFLKNFIPEIITWIIGGRVSENTEGVQNNEDDIDKLKDKVSIIEEEIDPFEDSDVPDGLPHLIKPAGKAVNNVKFVK